MVVTFIQHGSSSVWASATAFHGDEMPGLNFKLLLTSVIKMPGQSLDRAWDILGNS
jgi:hypothetical protein